MVEPLKETIKDSIREFHALNVPQEALIRYTKTVQQYISARLATLEYEGNPEPSVMVRDIYRENQ